MTKKKPHKELNSKVEAVIILVTALSVSFLITWLLALGGHPSSVWAMEILGLW